MTPTKTSEFAIDAMASLSPAPCSAVQPVTPTLMKLVNEQVGIPVGAYGEAVQALWEHMAAEHGVTLLMTEWQEIVILCRAIINAESTSEIPPRGSSQWGKWKKVGAQMKVGEEPVRLQTRVEQTALLRALKSLYGSGHYTSRKLTTGGWKVWRTA